MYQGKKVILGITRSLPEKICHQGKQVMYCGNNGHMLYQGKRKYQGKMIYRYVVSRGNSHVISNDDDGMIVMMMVFQDGSLTLKYSKQRLNSHFIVLFLQVT